MLHTCNKTEIPPKPNKKAVKIILTEIFLTITAETLLIPFVISKKPVIRGLIKLVSIRKNSKTGDKNTHKLERIPLDFKIEITLENITTNPPITKIVLILLVLYMLCY